MTSLEKNPCMTSRTDKERKDVISRLNTFLKYAKWLSPGSGFRLYLPKECISSFGLGVLSDIILSRWITPLTLSAYIMFHISKRNNALSVQESAEV